MSHSFGAADSSNEITHVQDEYCIGNIGLPKKSVRMNLVTITMRGQTGTSSDCLSLADEDNSRSKDTESDTKSASTRALTRCDSESLQFSVFGRITTDGDSDTESPVDVEIDVGTQKRNSSITLCLDAISEELYGL